MKKSVVFILIIFILVFGFVSVTNAQIVDLQANIGDQAYLGIHITDPIFPEGTSDMLVANSGNGGLIPARYLSFGIKAHLILGELFNIGNIGGLGVDINLNIMGVDHLVEFSPDLEDTEFYKFGGFTLLFLIDYKYEINFSGLVFGAHIGVGMGLFNFSIAFDDGGEKGRYTDSFGIAFASGIFTGYNITDKIKAGLSLDVRIGSGEATYTMVMGGSSDTIPYQNLTYIQIPVSVFFSIKF